MLVKPQALRPERPKGVPGPAPHSGATHSAHVPSCEVVTKALMYTPRKSSGRTGKP